MINLPIELFIVRERLELNEVSLEPGAWVRLNKISFPFMDAAQIPRDAFNATGRSAVYCKKGLKKEFLERAPFNCFRPHWEKSAMNKHGMTLVHHSVMRRMFENSSISNRINGYAETHSIGMGENVRQQGLLAKLVSWADELSGYVGEKWKYQRAVDPPEGVVEDVNMDSAMASTDFCTINRYELSQDSFRNQIPRAGTSGRYKKKMRGPDGEIKDWDLLSKRQKNRLTSKKRVAAVAARLFDGAMGKATSAYLESPEGRASMEKIVGSSAVLDDLIRGLTVDVDDALYKKDLVLVLYPFVYINMTPVTSYFIFQSSTSDRKHVILTRDNTTSDDGTGSMANVGQVRLHALKLFRRRLDEQVKKVFGMAVISDELIAGSRVVLNLKQVLEVSCL
jgi:hypothetical protein